MRRVLTILFVVPGFAGLVVAAPREQAAPGYPVVPEAGKWMICAASWMTTNRCTPLANRRGIIVALINTSLVVMESSPLS